MPFKPSEAVSLNIKVCTIFGCWPPREYNLTRNILYNLYGFCMILLIYVVFTSTLMLSMAHNTSLEEIVASLFISLTFLAMVPKYYNILIKRRAIRALLDKLDSDDMVTNGDPEIEAIVRDSIKKGRFSLLLMYCMGAANLLSYFVMPLPYLSERRLPFLAWYGVDHTITPWFELLYAYQFVGITVNCFINMSVDNFPCTVMSLSVGQLKILAYKIAQIGDPTKNDKEDSFDHLIVASCVRHHNFISQIVSEVEDIFGSSLFFQFLLSAFIICMTGFLLSTLSPTKNALEFAMSLVYFFTMCMQIYIPCYFGNEIMLQSELLTYAAFASSWARADLAIQKKLIIFTERTKKPLKICAGQMLELSLRTFTAIMNSAYKYYAVLQQMQSRK